MIYSICKIKNLTGAQTLLCGHVFEIAETYEIPDNTRGQWANNTPVLDAIIANDFQIYNEAGAIADHSEQVNLLKQTTLKVLKKPFADKVGHNFNGVGKLFTATASITTTMNFTVPTGTFDFSGIEIMHADHVGDTANLKILDDASGTYSGTPNALLNQFGWDWNIEQSACDEELPYTATLYTDMVVSIEYTNYIGTDQLVAINYYLHRII